MPSSLPFARELARITCVNTWLRLTEVAIDFACPRLGTVAKKLGLPSRAGSLHLQEL